MIFIIFLLISTVSWADFSLVRQQNLSNKLHQLVQPYEKKVGMFFIDLKSGWQFQLNGTREYPAASVAKMAVMAKQPGIDGKIVSQFVREILK